MRATPSKRLVAHQLSKTNAMKSRDSKSTAVCRSARSRRRVFESADHSEADRALDLARNRGKKKDEEIGMRQIGAASSDPCQRKERCLRSGGIVVPFHQHAYCGCGTI